MQDKDREHELSQKFTVEFTKEEAMLLLTSARLLDKLVAGVTIHARERDEIIKDIIQKLSQSVSDDVSHVANELADAIVDSVLGCDELDDDYAFISDALAMTLSDDDYLTLRRDITDELLGDKHKDLSDRDFFGIGETNFSVRDGELQEYSTINLPGGSAQESYIRDCQIDYPMYCIDKTLPVLEKALVNHHSVQAHYYSFLRESVDRVTLNPLVMIKENGLWRMVAFCRERGETLIFRVDRIKEISETAESFEAPVDASKITYTRLPAYS
ncbi:MAG: WYL domain-containing protein [Cyanobacteria bacterium SZAS LIN-2]|nr:WYL domain-containing protein [Cyanobacteria bacterium SZAS LIN-3]MBS1996913.1 WYL domain-containing protein [Cyanobacteria bacterium SZAS LIN-2]MBS2006494.1 WYL domain-containing protein [Cyanobacteria bacterium SZAS TMP-1]